MVIMPVILFYARYFTLNSKLSKVHPCEKVISSGMLLKSPKVRVSIYKSNAHLMTHIGTLNTGSLHTKQMSESPRDTGSD
jgi:hypothetical protein